jgi:hypothetical protein
VFSLINGRPLLTFIKTEPETWAGIAKYGLNMNGVYGIQQSFVKSSLLALYHRLFWVDKRFVRGVWAIAIFQWAWGITVLFVHIFACIPIAKSWYPTLDGWCVDMNLFFCIYEPINSAIDFIMAGQAIWMLHALQMSNKTRWHLSGLFILGAL